MSRLALKEVKDSLPVRVVVDVLRSCSKVRQKKGSRFIIGLSFLQYLTYTKHLMYTIN